MSFDFPLDDQQKCAVYHNGNALITACPGSGKTHVLSCRAAHILSDPGNRLVAVTFTRDSAIELKNRILELCERNPSKRMFTGTFHSTALSQFRRAKKTIRLLNGGEQYTILRSAWQKTKHNQKESFDDATKWLETVKSSMEVPSHNTALSEFYKSYQDSLESMGVCDFADLLIKSVRMMRSKEIPHIAATHMLVDESQDMDAVQLAWITHHARQGVEVTIVGDDDQSIYGFRNALGYEGMMQFKTDFDASHIILSTNYRSAPEVIYCASRLISYNTERVEKAVVAHKNIKGCVNAIETVNEVDEAEKVRQAIEESNPGTWAVLSRTNRALDAVEIELNCKQIPCRRIGGTNFWEKREAAIYLGLLKSLTKGDGVGEMLALHWAGVPKKVMDSIENEERSWENIEETISTLIDTKVDKAGRKIISGLLERRKGWIEAIRLDRMRLVISGVANWCKAQHEEEKRKTAPPIIDWCEKALNKLSGSLGSRIYALTNHVTKDSNEAAIVLMTIHNSKGMEFENVWLIGASEGLLPHVDSSVEEERRLAYVAMTRSRENLYISYFDGEKKKSRFIDEAGL